MHVMQTRLSPNLTFEAPLWDGSQPHSLLGDSTVMDESDNTAITYIYDTQRKWFPIFLLGTLSFVFFIGTQKI
jgi:hypothetical protein